MFSGFFLFNNINQINDNWFSFKSSKKNVVKSNRTVIILFGIYIEIEEGQLNIKFTALKISESMF